MTSIIAKSEDDLTIDEKIELLGIEIDLQYSHTDCYWQWYNKIFLSDLPKPNTK